MIFYLAAKYRYRHVVAQIADKLRRHDHTVIGDWLRGTHNGTTPESQSQYASIDFADIDSVEALVLFQFSCDEPEASTGRHVEYGYALGRQKQVIIVGKRTSVFHYTKDVITYPSLDAFYASYARAS